MLIFPVRHAAGYSVKRRTEDNNINSVSCPVEDIWGSPFLSETLSERKKEQRETHIYNQRPYQHAGVYVHQQLIKQLHSNQSSEGFLVVDGVQTAEAG